MARVDFYLLKEGDVRQRGVAICRLANKAFLQGMTSFVYTRDTAESENLDALMWTFQADSFIPHTQEKIEFDAHWPVAIHHTAPQKKFDVLITLVDIIPPFSDQFARIVEVIGSDDADKKNARERYRLYRERGHELQTHDI